MKKDTAFKIIAYLSLAGSFFAGYLSFTEIFPESAALCPSGACSQQIAGLPVCVYGLAMFIIIMIISIAGLASRK